MGFFPNVEKMKARGDVGGLIKVLKDGVFRFRTEAAEALREIGEPAVEPLIQALADKNEDIRAGAAEALGNIRDKRAVEPLIQALADKKEHVRSAAARALGEMKWEPKNDALKAWYLAAKSDWEELIKVGEPAKEPLIHALRHVWGLREVAGALGEIGEPAVGLLIQALKDKSWGVQGATAEALGKIGEPAVEPLIQALKDKHVGQAEAANALGKMGEPGVEPLIQALKDENEDVRWAAAWALMDIGDRRAEEALTQAALKDESPGVRWVASEAVAKMRTVWFP